MPASTPWWTKWGPFVLMFVAAILINADPFRHVLQDLDIWESPSSSEYRQKCHDETFHCMSPLGLYMTVGMTYLGFTLLMIAALWNANVMSKCKAIKDQWNDLRGRKQRVGGSGVWKQQLVDGRKKGI